MACLQFRYDGYKRPNRNREMCFFPQRFPYQNQSGYVPRDYSQLENQREVSVDENTQDKEVENKEEFEKTTITENEHACPLKDSYTITSDQSIEADSPKETKQKGKRDYTHISEILISKLSNTQTNLSEIRNMVEIGKPFLDDFLYKLESFMQIIEIVKANDRRRYSKSQTEVASLKTTKDSYDEFLELLQGPVFQNVLRQFLVSMMVRDDDVTKYSHTT